MSLRLYIVDLSSAVIQCSDYWAYQACKLGHVTDGQRGEITNPIDVGVFDDQFTCHETVTKQLNEGIKH
jgi:hypothetical protein